MMKFLLNLFKAQDQIDKEALTEMRSDIQEHLNELTSKIGMGPLMKLQKEYKVDSDKSYDSFCEWRSSVKDIFNRSEPEIVASGLINPNLTTDMIHKCIIDGTLNSRLEKDIKFKLLFELSPYFRIHPEQMGKIISNHILKAS